MSVPAVRAGRPDPDPDPDPVEQVDPADPDPVEHAESVPDGAADAARCADPASPRAAGAAPPDRPWRRALFAGGWVWLGTRVALAAMSAFAWIGQRQPGISGSEIAHRWATQFDSAHFLAIAAKGYVDSNTEASAAFFPAYPLLIRVLTPVALGRDWLAALVISNVALLAALVLLYRLAEHEFDRSTANRTIFYLVAFPTALFLTAAYNEGLSIALAVGAVYATRLRRWWTAGVLGALATTTRSAGLLLVLPFCYEYLRTYRWRPRPGALAVALIPLGLAPIMIATASTMHDPLAFEHAQSLNWGRHLDWPWVPVYDGIREVIVTRPGTRFGDVWAHDLLELGVVLLLAALILLGLVGPLRVRRDQLVFPLYGLALLVFTITFPILHNPRIPFPLYSASRIGIEVFPAFLILGRLGRHPFVDRAVLAGFLGVQGILVMQYLGGGWVA
ncbi:mannosyltransferase family protein [Rugosimonospora acidiphila]|uniref:mannosyltransferase family protein n=1 Tax=Rugosimonospora acidiphila TaxID=556531 RepID=UPI0031E6950C